MMHDTIIIGAGLAGLCCGLRLTEAGRSPLILDAADAVGGRIRTDRIDGFRLDRGFQVFLTAYPEAQAKLNYETLKLCPFEPGAKIRFDGRFHNFLDPWRRPWKGLRSAFAPIGSLRDKLRIAKLRRECLRGSLEDCFTQPETTSHEFLRSFGFSDAIIERFFRPFLGGVFLEPNLTTSSRMLRFVFRMFSAGAASLPEAGMQAIPEQLASRLPAAAIRLHARVKSIDRNRVELESGEVLDAAAVVIATDAHAAARLLGQPAPAEGPGVTCHYYDAPEPPEREPILVLNGEGHGLVNNLCVPSLVTPTYAPPGRHLISATVLGIHEDSEAAAREHLESWYGPGVKRWQHLKTYAIRNALPGTPPQQASVRLGSGIYTCGDHLDNGSIQGAMVSGRRAAEALLEDRR